jgi:hypothetical protein
MSGPVTYDQMEAYVGKRVRIEKFGAVLEGAVRGPSGIGTLKPSLEAERRWCLVPDSGTDIHFVPEQWIITIL